MRFEWDEEKNRMNVQKHGVSFNDVIVLFDYPMIVHLDVRHDYEEHRWVGIG